MEEKKLFRLPVVSMVVLILLMISPTMACPPQVTKCEDCVLDQIKHGCRSCVPMLRCMARCLWSGASRAECNKKCDCNGGKLTLSDCKKCMSRCKCSCAAAAAA